MVDLVFVLEIIVDEICECMSGNICCCGVYVNIFVVIEDVVGEIKL